MESIPEGLEFNFSTTHPSIFQAWLNLMDEAQSSIDIASFYWTLTNEDTGTHEPTAIQVSWSSSVSADQPENVDWLPLDILIKSIILSD